MVGNRKNHPVFIRFRKNQMKTMQNEALKRLNRMIRIKRGRV
jgi:hypothetical protein